MRRFSNVLLFGLSALLALLVGDAYLQFAGIQTPMETRIDHPLGPTYIPGKGISRFSEGFYLGEANAYGYMGPPVPPRRNGAERRILLLGDSFVLGHTVLPRHHFGRALELLLRGATGEMVQVLNFGKADFNLSDMYAYHRSFAGTFDHDLTLFFVGEDDLIPVGQTASGLYPQVRLRGGEPVVDSIVRNSRAFRFYGMVEPVLTRSAVLRLAFNAYKVFQRGALPAVLLGKFAPALEWAAAYAGAPPAAPAAPVREAVLPGISLAILHDLSRDPRNVLVIQHDIAPSLRHRLNQLGLPVLDLGEALAQLEARGEDPYYWPVTKLRGHWNHTTHRRIAEFLAETLAERELLWPSERQPIRPASQHRPSQNGG